MMFEKVCKFTFSVKDELGFFIHLMKKAGQPIQNNHPKQFDPSIIPILSLLLDEYELEDIITVVQSTCGKAHGRNFMHGKFGKLINSLKVDYLYRKFNNH